MSAEIDKTTLALRHATAAPSLARPVLESIVIRKKHALATDGRMLAVMHHSEGKEVDGAPVMMHAKAATKMKGIARNKKAKPNGKTVPGTARIEVGVGEARDQESGNGIIWNQRDSITAFPACASVLEEVAPHKVLTISPQILKQIAAVALEAGVEQLTLYQHSGKDGSAPDLRQHEFRGRVGGDDNRGLRIVFMPMRESRKLSVDAEAWKDLK